LVDLPGLTKVAVSNQPKDIDVKIKKIVMDYIRSPSCIILAISSANTDLATSDAMQEIEQLVF